MKFMILNGSPKSEKSVTLQSMRYLDKHNKKHEFKYFHVNKEIKKFEEDRKFMERFCKEMKECDGVIWSFPVYIGHIPSNYKRFIELIFEYNLEDYFENKYTTVFSTSIHYYDHTAQNYIHSICDDLNMNYINYLSHDMNDLLKKDRRIELSKFFHLFVDCIKDDIKFTKEYKPLSKLNFRYIPTLEGSKISTKKKTFIITDAREDDVNVKNMIEKYKNCVDGHIEVFNLNDVDMKGSCIGCCRCGYDNTCIYKDGFKEFYDHIIHHADIIIYALSMKDRYLSSLYSKYRNRAFVYNHVPVFKGKQIGYMISGSIHEDKNAIQLMEEAGALISVISDECGESRFLDKEIENFAKLGIKRSDENYIRKDNFLGVGGKKIFVDEIGNSLSGIFLADYKYYKKHNYIPKKDLKSVIEKLKNLTFRYFMSKEKFRGEVHKNMYEHMVSDHVKLVKGTKV